MPAALSSPHEIPRRARSSLGLTVEEGRTSQSLQKKINKKRPELPLPGAEVRQMLGIRLGAQRPGSGHHSLRQGPAGVSEAQLSLLLSPQTPARPTLKPQLPHTGT